MRLRINCVACLQADGKPSDDAESVEMRDDGLYSVTCRRGHTTITAVREQKFEILFDLGAMALLDGYPREAITSMAAAVERFFEYYIQVISLKHGITFETFTKAWKPVSRQSERQLGAFLAVYLFENKKALQSSIVDAQPNDSFGRKNPLTWTAFRNEVTHNGYIPSSEEVLAYGDLVYQFVYRLIEELRGTSPDHMLKATFHHVGRGSALAKGASITTMSIPTLICLAVASRPASTFAEALKGLEAYRPWHSYAAQLN
jgi:hypothetical protein